MKALVIGKSGQVASELLVTCPSQIIAIAYSRNDIDILDIASLQAIVEIEKPDIIINASAYTSVDLAESEQDSAFAINGYAVANLASLAKKYNIRLIHISTDFVFDGKQSVPYKKDDIPNPINIYGKSKLAGEKAIQDIYPDNSAIIRTSWVYSCYGTNFVKTMLKLMVERDTLNVVCDQIGTPTYAKCLAEYIWKIVSIDKVDQLYHFSNLGATSWYDFALAIQEIALELGILSRKITIYPISTIKYPTPAKRPQFSLLEKNKCSESLHWRIALRNMLENLCKD